MAKNIDFNNSEIELPDNDSVSFNPNAFDAAIESQGIQMIHYQAMACPVGLVDPNDVTRRPHEDHEGCSNGFVYEEVGSVTVLFVSNTMSKKDLQMGLGDSSTARITLPRYYDSECCPQGEVMKVRVAPFDRFYIKEDANLEVLHWERHESNPSGIDRLSFPIKEVLWLKDSQGRNYSLGTDFTITKNGYIQWVLNHAPPVDPKTNRGGIYSIRYIYRPFFYVTNLVHELRVAQVIDPETGERHVERMPQSAVLQREYVFMSDGSDNKKDSASVRMQYLPRSGSFGPR